MPPARERLGYVLLYRGSEPPPLFNVRFYYIDSTCLVHESSDDGDYLLYLDLGRQRELVNEANLRLKRLLWRP